MSIEVLAFMGYLGYGIGCGLPWKYLYLVWTSSSTAGGLIICIFYEISTVGSVLYKVCFIINYLTFSDSYKWQPLPRNTMHSQHTVFLSKLAGLNIRDSILTNLFTKKFICLINNAVSGGIVSQNRRGSNSKKLQTRLGTLQKRMIDLRSGLIRCRWGKTMRCNQREDLIQILTNHGIKMP